jgi:hypothetical protein
MSTPREKELERALRQKEAEIKHANGELEDRGKLLYKTKASRAEGPGIAAPECARGVAAERP